MTRSTTRKNAGLLTKDQQTSSSSSSSTVKSGCTTCGHTVKGAIAIRRSIVARRKCASAARMCVPCAGRLYAGPTAPVAAAVQELIEDLAIQGVIKSGPGGVRKSPLPTLVTRLTTRNIVDNGEPLPSQQLVEDCTHTLRQLSHRGQVPADYIENVSGIMAALHGFLTELAELDASEFNASATCYALDVRVHESKHAAAGHVQSHAARAWLDSQCARACEAYDDMVDEECGASPGADDGEDVIKHVHWLEAAAAACSLKNIDVESGMFLLRKGCAEAAAWLSNHVYDALIGTNRTGLTTEGAAALAFSQCALDARTGPLGDDMDRGAFSQLTNDFVDHSECRAL